MTMHVAEAVARIRAALRRKSGRTWSVSRTDYEGAESPPVMIHVMPRHRRRGRMALERRRELAALLGLRNAQQVPPEGLIADPPYERWVEAAEA